MKASEEILLKISSLVLWEDLRMMISRPTSRANWRNSGTRQRFVVSKTPSKAEKPSYTLQQFFYFFFGGGYEPWCIFGYVRGLFYWFVPLGEPQKERKARKLPVDLSVRMKNQHKEQKDLKKEVVGH